MQCNTLKQAVADSRSRLGESSTGIKLRFGNDGAFCAAGKEKAFDNIVMPFKESHLIMARL
jgi:hypothetical protein